MTSVQIRQRASKKELSSWPLHIHPVLRRVYSARGIDDPLKIAHRLSHLASPTTLGGTALACEILAQTLQREQQIVVVGDFDADGATGTAVAVRGLRLLGATKVSYRVPNRFMHGYGLSTVFVETFADNPPDLIITVDNGIASHAGVVRARELGIKVIITDHHLPGDTLPSADALVNPNLPSDNFPSKSLAGVGVMFYLLLALRAFLRETKWFEQHGKCEPDLAALLDLVALGTIADLVPLDFNNRILVETGLKRIRSGKANAGINALLVASSRDPNRVVASDLGFVVAPRVNAAGRLEDMSLGIECLLADDKTVADVLAERLSAINIERRELQANMMDQGEFAVTHWLQTHGQEQLPFGMVLFEPDWHPGVVGLVASRLKEKFHRPVVACAPATAGSSEIRASARSITGFHIRDALAEIDTRYPGLIVRFGGHAMAAGLTLAKENLPIFTTAFDTVARERITPEQLEAVLYTDGELAPHDFCLDLAQQLRYAGPWGQAFPEPVFDNCFELHSWRVIGENHLRLKLNLAPDIPAVEAIYFGGYQGVPPPTYLRVAYQLDINNWRGEERLQLLVRYMEPA